MTTDEKYMMKCLELAELGRGSVSPNPMVGSIIVYNDEIISEGYHEKYGEAHAEANAIKNVKDTSVLPHSTLYVNLEPCSHQGKQPPCADLIVKNKIKRVVIGMGDPNSLVAGRGIKRLRDNGIEVTENVLLDKCLELNKRFIVYHTYKRPFVILKWAQTADGFIDISRDSVIVEPLLISSQTTKVHNHKMRTEEDSIMVGTNTAILDNPHLTVRHWQGRNPLRIVIDRELKIPLDYKLLDDSTKTIVFCDKDKEEYKNKCTNNTKYIGLDFSNNIIPAILHCLHCEGVGSIIVEGGRILLQSFIDSELWDECYIEIGEVKIGKGVEAPKIEYKEIETTQYENSKITIGKR